MLKFLVEVLFDNALSVCVEDDVREDTLSSSVT